MNIKIEYILSTGEYLEAFDEYYKKGPFRLLDITANVVLIVIGLLLILENVMIFLGIIFILIGCSIAIKYLRLSRLVARMRFAQSDKAQEKQTVQFSDEGLHYAIKSATSNIAWSFYSGFSETRNVAMLWYDNNQFSVLPKRAFSEETLKQFRDFCKTRWR